MFAFSPWYIVFFKIIIILILPKMCRIVIIRVLILKTWNLIAWTFNLISFR